ncbi:MAG: UDP-N-acetylglucosamine 2-epimerase (non-hydrolyzing) [Aestuariivirga sp.]
MARLKVMTVVGTRPEIIRLSRVMAVLDREVDHSIVHTGQNYDYELNQIFFDELGIRKPDFFLEAARGTAAQTIGQIIAKIDEVLEKQKPEALLILGDTNSCLSAISAKKRKIPIFHMEAGNRCFDQRVPEETNRKIVDHIADINLTYSDHSRQHLLAEGLPPDRIIKTGSPMFEVLSHYRTLIEQSKIVSELGLEPRKFFLVSAHREENIDDPVQLQKLASSLNLMATTFKQPILMSMHPRTKNRLEGSGLKLDPLVRQLKPFGFFDYNALQMSARVTLSDSGTISEESSILNFPALNIREAHERPEAMEEAAVMMTGLDPERILQALPIAEAQARGNKRDFMLVRDYAVPNVSEKVLRIIISYVDYVRRNVWKK